MVGSTLITMRLVRSKLRKREESSVSPVGNGVESQVVSSPEHQTAPVAFRQTNNSVWVFPPLPPQPNIYSVNSHVSRAFL